MLGKYYEAVSVGVASVSATEDGPTQKAIGLSFPLAEPVRPDDLEHDDNYEDVFISVAAAKSLMVDLRDMIETVVDDKSFG